MRDKKMISSKTKNSDPMKISKAQNLTFNKAQKGNSINWTTKKWRRNLNLKKRTLKRHSIKLEMTTMISQERTKDLNLNLSSQAKKIQ